MGGVAEKTSLSYTTVEAFWVSFGELGSWKKCKQQKLTGDGAGGAAAGDVELLSALEGQLGAEGLGARSPHPRGPPALA